MKVPPRALAAVWFVYGLVGLLAGGVFALWFGGFAVLMSVLPDERTGEPAPWWMSGVFASLASCALLFVLVGTLPALATGWGMWRDRPWVRPVALIAAVFTLFTGLPWMALGLVTLYHLWETERASRPARVDPG